MIKRTRRPDWLVVGIIACLLIQLFCATNFVFADGSLSKIRKVVRKNEAPPKKTKPSKPSREREAEKDHHIHRRDSKRRHSRNHSFLGLSFSSRPSQPVSPVFVSNTVYSPAVHCPPPVVVAARQDYTIQNEIVPAPRPIVPAPQFEDQLGSSVLYAEPPTEAFEFGDDFFQSSLGRFWATVGSDFDLFSKADLGLQIQAPGGLGIDASVFNLREQSGAVRDHVWLGDANLMFELVSRQDVRGRLGLGVNWMNDGWGSVAGFNLTGGFDVRLNERWTFNAEGDIGSLGDADFFHARLGLGRRFEEVEWINGIDHFNIGGIEINSVFTGIQFRF